MSASFSWLAGTAERLAPGLAVRRKAWVVAGGADGCGVRGIRLRDAAGGVVAPFVAAGTGIKPGVQLGLINNVDVAPTIARLMGLAMKDVDGRVLTEILAE